MVCRRSELCFYGQNEYLLSRNCKSFQGYYFGKPISATALTQMLKSYKPPLFQLTSPAEG